MKRFFTMLLALLLLLCGCASKKPGSIRTDYQAITPVGNVPEAFKTIVENDLFAFASAFEDRLVKYERKEYGYLFSMYDFSGALLGSHAYNTDIGTFHVSSMAATSDGGFIFALGFSDHANSDGTRESQNGVYSRVIKCAPDGSIQWDIPLENYTYAMLCHFFELEDAYYFIGEQETPETKKTGVLSPTDIHIMKLNKDGTVLSASVIGGSDFDCVWQVKKNDGNFTLFCDVQSTDGDFTSDGCWNVTIDSAFHILSMEKAAYTSFGEYIGFLNGEPVFSKDTIWNDFADGTPTAILDYGDFYLTVSQNITGLYENQPLMLSHLWCYTETVYAAYDNDGNILWKAAVDSSPDYDSMAANLYDLTQ